jgi:hypothetical protein
MAAHSVKLKVEHPLNVGNLGVEFEVRRGGKLLGKLEVTQSTIEWTPAKARNPRKASWQDFGDWMEARSGRPAPARPAPGQARSADAVEVAETAEVMEPVEIDAVEVFEDEDEDDIEVDNDDVIDADVVEVDEVDVDPPPTTRSSWV